MGRWVGGTDPTRGGGGGDWAPTGYWRTTRPPPPQVAPPAASSGAALRLSRTVDREATATVKAAGERFPGGHGGAKAGRVEQAQVRVFFTKGEAHYGTQSTCTPEEYRPPHFSLQKARTNASKCKSSQKRMRRHLSMHVQLAAVAETLGSTQAPPPLLTASNHGATQQEKESPATSKQQQPRKHLALPRLLPQPW